jgi:Pyruvate/2-oxoacid:ferredoxin oxidoreductase delta subunit
MSLLVNWLESLAGEVRVEQSCLRRKSPKVTCSACSDVCPKAAITLAKRDVFVDSTACNQCGLCVIACPTSSITGSPPLRQFEGSALLYEMSASVPLVKELLIYYGCGIRGIVSRDGALRAEWLEVIDEVNQRLMVAIVDASPLKVEVIDATHQKLTRRQWLSSLQKDGKSVVKKLAPAAWRVNANGWRLSTYYPNTAFFKVEIDQQKCNHCEVCCKLCPENLFTLTKDGSITITKPTCTNCHLCTNLCPTQAITITPPH